MSVGKLEQTVSDLHVENPFSHRLAILTRPFLDLAAEAGYSEQQVAAFVQPLTTCDRYLAAFRDDEKLAHMRLLSHVRQGKGMLCLVVHPSRSVNEMTKVWLVGEDGRNTGLGCSVWGAFDSLKVNAGEGVQFVCEPKEEYHFIWSQHFWDADLRGDRSDFFARLQSPLLKQLKSRPECVERFGSQLHWSEYSYRNDRGTCHMGFLHGAKNRYFPQLVQGGLENVVPHTKAPRAVRESDLAEMPEVFRNISSPYWYRLFFAQDEWRRQGAMIDWFNVLGSSGLLWLQVGESTWRPDAVRMLVVGNDAQGVGAAIYRAFKQIGVETRNSVQLVNTEKKWFLWSTDFLRTDIGDETEFRQRLRNNLETAVHSRFGSWTVNWWIHGEASGLVDASSYFLLNKSCKSYNEDVKLLANMKRQVLPNGQLITGGDRTTERQAEHVPLLTSRRKVSLGPLVEPLLYLNDSHRRSIMELLLTKGCELSVGEIQQQVGHSLQYTSAALHELLDKGYINIRKGGRYRYVSVRHDIIGPALENLAALFRPSATSKSKF